MWAWLLTLVFVTFHVQSHSCYVLFQLSQVPCASLTLLHPPLSCLSGLDHVSLPWLPSSFSWLLFALLALPAGGLPWPLFGGPDLAVSQAGRAPQMSGAPVLQREELPNLPTLTHMVLFSSQEFCGIFLIPSKWSSTLSLFSLLSTSTTSPTSLFPFLLSTLF